jgi:predicted nucleotidyltransferase
MAIVEHVMVASRVREVIAASGRSQSEFARDVGLDAPKLSKSLAGRRRFMSKELVRIAALGGVSVDWLLGSSAALGVHAERRGEQELGRDVPVDFDALRPQIAELCQRYGIAELDLFGSTARGEARPDSDVDILYVRQPGNDLGMRYFELKDDLERLFGRSVDLVPRDGLHWIIRDDVLAEAKELYAAT